ncbi:uncharacterized protein LOC116137398 [Pistacia vera]|uniref:uncharacterized protein LOC116137398 n=1 Tax=Pistacia vera TaxID=55513 RepID=UPI001263AC28|nr:uncharacterized protein LOC116137398 [Pistacia vera]
MGLVGVGSAAQSQILAVRSGYSSKFMELRWVRRKERSGSNLNLKPSISMIPIYISTNPSHINLQDLKQLYTSCNHSCHRFPKLDPKGGKVEEAVDIDKLSVALSHSPVLVSLFSRNLHLESSNQMFKNFMQRMMPVTPSNGQLVGFGRAVSDAGLTASIHDVMVIPSLRGMGIGRLIVKRIIRMLTSRDIYDIAALCSQEERLFFEACGFGDDILSSTTMMYTKNVATHDGGDHMVRRAGRKLLLVPPLREPWPYLKPISSKS